MTSSSAEAAENAAPLRLAHPDWLHHQLTIRGPGEALAALRGAAAGAISWRLDLARIEEDWFHLLMAPPAPQQRSLSAAGARILARQLREAAEHRHRLALSRVGRSCARPVRPARAAAGAGRGSGAGTRSSGRIGLDAAALGHQRGAAPCGRGGGRGAGGGDLLRDLLQQCLIEC